MTYAADDAHAFDWVDDYLAHIRPHFEVRPDDSLLIVMPNKAVKLNSSGLGILRFLKNGGSIEQVLGRVGGQTPAPPGSLSLPVRFPQPDDRLPRRGPWPQGG